MFVLLPLLLLSNAGLGVAALQTVAYEAYNPTTSPPRLQQDLDIASRLAGLLALQYSRWSSCLFSGCPVSDADAAARGLSTEENPKLAHGVAKRVSADGVDNFHILASENSKHGWAVAEECRTDGSNVLWVSFRGTMSGGDAHQAGQLFGEDKYGFAGEFKSVKVHEGVHTVLERNLTAMAKQLGTTTTSWLLFSTTKAARTKADFESFFAKHSVCSMQNGFYNGGVKFAGHSLGGAQALLAGSFVFGVDDWEEYGEEKARRTFDRSIVETLLSTPGWNALQNMTKAALGADKLTGAKSYEKVQTIALSPSAPFRSMYDSAEEETAEEKPGLKLTQTKNLLKHRLRETKSVIVITGDDVVPRFQGRDVNTFGYGEASPLWRHYGRFLVAPVAKHIVFPNTRPAAQKFNEEFYGTSAFSNLKNTVVEVPIEKLEPNVSKENPYANLITYDYFRPDKHHQHRLTAENFLIKGDEAMFQHTWVFHCQDAMHTCYDSSNPTNFMKSAYVGKGWREFDGW